MLPQRAWTVKLLPSSFSVVFSHIFSASSWCVLPCITQWNNIFRKTALLHDEDERFCSEVGDLYQTEGLVHGLTELCTLSWKQWFRAVFSSCSRYNPLWLTGLKALTNFSCKCKLFFFLFFFFFFGFLHTREFIWCRTVSWVELKQHFFQTHAYLGTCIQSLAFSYWTNVFSLP